MIFSTLRRYIKIPALVLAVEGPLALGESLDIINPDIKTAKSFKKHDDNETGIDRIKRMFQVE